MKARKPYVALGFLLAAGLGLLAVIQGCGADLRASQEIEPYLHRALTRTVEIQPGYILEREFAGEVRAGQSSELGFEMAGQVIELLVDEGEEIQRGQVLARLDDDLLRSERDELNAQVAELDAELQTVRRDLERVESLRSENLVSERERDNLAGRVEVLEASLARVTAALRANQIRLDKSQLRAPFNSRIAVRHVDSGVVVDAGQPIFGLVETGAREIRAGVPVGLAERLLPGDAVEVRVGNQFSEGQVIQVAPVVNQSTQSRAVRVAVDEQWAPGGLAYLLIGVEIEMPGAWLPDSAVTEGLRGTWVVYAVVPEGDGEAILESRNVVIHHASAGRLYVSGALRDGEAVVISGLHRLAPGQRVRPEAEPFEALSVTQDAH